MDLELEQAIIRRFVIPSKRERCLAFAAEARARHKTLSLFNDPAAFDERCVTEIAGHDRASPEQLIGRLRELGMGGRVYVMSRNDDWDGKKFQTSYIVGECVGACIDTLGYCWKTKTAFFEWHHSGATYFLRSR